MEKVIKYKQIEDDILNDIRTGKLLPGDKIAAESALKKKYKVSTITVRKAFNDLINAGYLFGVQGLGTYVSKARVERDTASIDLYRDIKAKGMDTKLEVVSIKKSERDEIRKILEAEDDETVYCISRVRYSNGFPIAYHQSYISKLTSSELKNCKKYDSFYAFLDSYGLEPEWVKESYHAIGVSHADTCEYLKLKKGTPAFYAIRIAYDAQNRPIEYCESVFEKDHYSVTTTIKNIK